MKCWRMQMRLLRARCWRELGLSPATPLQELHRVKLPRTGAGRPHPPAAASPNESPLCSLQSPSHHEERAFTTAEDRSGTEPSPGGSDGQHKRCSTREKQIHQRPGDASPGESHSRWVIKTPQHNLHSKVGQSPMSREAQQWVPPREDAHKAAPAILEWCQSSFVSISHH